MSGNSLGGCCSGAGDGDRTICCVGVVVGEVSVGEVLEFAMEARSASKVGEGGRGASCGAGCGGGILGEVVSVRAGSGGLTSGDASGRGSGFVIIVGGDVSCIAGAGGGTTTSTAVTALREGD